MKVGKGDQKRRGGVESPEDYELALRYRLITVERAKVFDMASGADPIFGPVRKAFSLAQERRWKRFLMQFVIVWSNDLDSFCNFLCLLSPFVNYRRDARNDIARAQETAAAKLRKMEKLSRELADNWHKAGFREQDGLSLSRVLHLEKISKEVSDCAKRAEIERKRRFKKGNAIDPYENQALADLVSFVEKHIPKLKTSITPLRKGTFAVTAYDKARFGPKTIVLNAFAAINCEITAEGLKTRLTNYKNQTE